jgi:putative tryptophan/tyrosine transport system substrate-binding protein
MTRREFIALLGGGAAAVWPLAARAQQPERMRRIGVLMGAVESDPARQSQLTAFRGALAKLGWREGSNLGIEVRWGGDPELCARYATELVALGPEVILADSSPSGGAAAANTHDPDSIRHCRRPDRPRLCREPCAPRWQHNRLQRFRRADGGQMA